jgi:hypothetical protein
MSALPLEAQSLWTITNGIGNYCGVIRTRSSSIGVADLQYIFPVSPFGLAAQKSEARR